MPAFRSSRIVLAAMALLLVPLPAAMSDVPQLLNFQGVLLNDAGVPVTTPVSVLFSIWNAESGGTAVWSETRTVDPDDSGRFSILLGEVTPVTAAAFAGTGRWLGVKVGNDPEMVPRTRVTTAPFSFRTATVDGAAGGSLTGNVAVMGNVGIGTANPTERLQVAGVIHSTSGGVRFPDGTLQSTAAPPEPTQLFDSAFRNYTLLQGLGQSVNVFTVGLNLTRYVTGISICCAFQQTVTVLIGGQTVLALGSTGASGNSWLGSWSSGGGAPLIVQSGQTLTVRSTPGQPEAVGVTVTGYEL